MVNSAKKALYRQDELQKIVTILFAFWQYGTPKQPNYMMGDVVLFNRTLIV